MGTAYTWIGAVSGDISVAGNYSPSGVPTTGDTIFIPDTTTQYWPTTGTVTCDSVLANTLAEMWGGDWRNCIFINWGQLHDGLYNNLENNNCIFGGTHYGDVENNGFIYGGDYTNASKIDNAYNIFSGTFACTVYNTNTITDGTFNGIIFNSANIVSGTFNGAVENDGTILTGIYNNSVDNNNYIADGLFKSSVINVAGLIDGGEFRSYVSIDEDSVVQGGSFSGQIELYGGVIGTGSFYQSEGGYLYIDSGTINDGWYDIIGYNNGDIYGGTFNSYWDNSGDVYGGTWNGAINHYGHYFEADCTDLKQITLFESATFVVYKGINGCGMLASM